jgi:redox-sensing transcriptional repressor
LSTKLKEILHVDRIWPVILVGAGDLGRAVAGYGGFVNRGYRIAAVYDSDPEKIGRLAGKFTILNSTNLEQDIQRNGYRVAMLTVPAAKAQAVADVLVRAGVRAILCYAPTSVSVPPEVQVQYIDPVLHLQRMTYYLK